MEQKAALEKNASQSYSSLAQRQQQLSRTPSANKRPHSFTARSRSNSRFHGELAGMSRNNSNKSGGGGGGSSYSICSGGAKVSRSNTNKSFVSELSISNPKHRNRSQSRPESLNSSIDDNDVDFVALPKRLEQ
ncbi:hypothetical protein HK100_000539 [Physocladia obscura]|uniref:Uncharacterized protein n=1 Tax=Physocladia obscura TaxID=109957 RepID=A0AAD5XBR1_9FUNG|nr:hypothetical protein HK100_000539 [Physocladia obscura]